MTYLCHSRTLRDLILMVVCAATAAQGQAPSEQTATIVRTLEAQAAAWNRADLSGFMAAYWNSDELTFSSGGTTRRGWQTIYDNYQAKYGGQGDLGALTFSDLNVQELGPEHALVMGDWGLIHQGKKSQGNFSLVLAKIEGEWKIIHDHTSVRE